MSKILSEVLEATQSTAPILATRASWPCRPRGVSPFLLAWTRASIPQNLLAEGDAHVIRNAGGRASDDAIRSLVINYKLLGAQEFFVLHHTNCGMELFTNEVMRDLLSSSLETAQLTSSSFRDVGKGPGDRSGEYIEWLTIKDQRQPVLGDVARIRNHPLVPKSIPVHGYFYDVAHGKPVGVEGARAVGASA